MLGCSWDVDTMLAFRVSSRTGNRSTRGTQPGLRASCPPSGAASEGGVRAHGQRATVGNS